MKRETQDSDPLPSRPSGGALIGGILAGLDHALMARPKPVTHIEEPYRDAWASAEGMTVEGLDDPIERPEPPDRSRAQV